MQSFWRHVTFVLWTIITSGCTHVDGVKRENRCMRHYFVETIRHPTKDCEYKNILLSRCKGFCPKSRTQPVISFSPILTEPFRYYCSCCREQLSVMKAVKLRCKGGEAIYATYRYIIRCRCESCRR